METLDTSNKSPVLSRIVALLSPEQTDVLLEDEAFCDVTGFVGELAEKYGAKLEMFESGGFVPEFHDLFVIVQEFVDRGILKIREMVSNYGLSKYYPDGWEDLARTMVYLAFYAHYGQYRRAECDQEGRKLPYIFHILRAAFSDFAVKVGVLGAETVCAHPLHDVLEELPRSFFVKGMKIDRNSVPELGDDIRGFIADRSARYCCDDVKVDSYIHGLTKPDSLKELGRFRESFEMLLGICYAASCSETDSQKFLEKLVLFCMKAGDMLDNHSSAVLSQKDDSPEAVSRVRGIMDEALFLFLPQLQGLHMRNAEEWLRDQIGLSDPEQRKFAHRNLAVFEDEGVEFRERFLLEFSARMNARGPSGSIGEDYVVILRPRGIRNRRNILARTVAGEGAASHLKGFNNNIIFVCLAEDPRKKNQLCRNAHAVFREIFSNPVREGMYRDERYSAFGRRFMFGKDPGNRKRGTENFGTGSFLVCRSPKDAVTMFYGDVHGACLYRDHKSFAFASAFYKRVAQSVLEMSREIAVLDNSRLMIPVASDPDSVSAGVRSILSDCVSETGDELLSNPSQLRALDRLMDTKIKAVFARHASVPVSVNGDETRVVRVPLRSTLGCVFLYSDFLRSCNAVERVVINPGADNEMVLVPGEPCPSLGVPGPLRMNRILGLRIPENASVQVQFSDNFDPNSADLIEKFMHTQVLSPFRDRLLGRRPSTSKPVAQ